VSLNVLVVLEDSHLDKFIAIPIVERIFRDLGKPNARVSPLEYPRVMGHHQAYEIVSTDLEDYRQSHSIWIFLQDADCARDIPYLREKVAQTGVRLASIAIHPEIEVWLLAGFAQAQTLGLWDDVRKHHRLKEEVFEPFMRSQNVGESVGGGRKELMREALKNWNTLKTRCPEITELTQQLKEILEQIP
jgi:hypothetical protein